MIKARKLSLQIVRGGVALAVVAALFVWVSWIHGAWAQATNPGCGQQVMEGAWDIITGNLGTILGLLVSLFGFGLFLNQQKLLGTIVLLNGVAITATPGLYMAFLNGSAGIFGNITISQMGDFEVVSAGNCEQFEATPPDLSFINWSDLTPVTDSEGNVTGYTDEEGNTFGVDPVTGEPLPPAATGTTASELGWSQPYDINGFPVTSNYGMRQHPITGQWKMHKGVDIGMPVGTPLQTPFENAEVVDVRNQMGSNGVGWGWLVTIRDPVSGYTVQYNHLQAGSINVSEGQTISSGTIFANSGASGGVTGPHLDLMVRDPSGNLVNPQEFFGIPQR